MGNLLTTQPLKEKWKKRCTCNAHLNGNEIYLIMNPIYIYAHDSNTQVPSSDVLVLGVKSERWVKCSMRCIVKVLIL